MNKEDKLMKRRGALSLLMMLLVGLALFAVQGAAAFSSGISGFSGMNGQTCTVCHGAGVEPTVALQGPTQVALGQTATYSLTITSGDPSNQTAAGLNVAAEAGELVSINADTQIISGEVTHTTPKANDAGGTAVFTFDWTAPQAPTTVLMYAAGNSVNLNGSPSGDLPATDMVTINVGTPTDVTLTEVTGESGLPTWIVVSVALIAGLFTYLLIPRFSPWKRNEA
jgi:hypothetical protein